MRILSWLSLAGWNLPDATVAWAELDPWLRMLPLEPMDGAGAAGARRPVTWSIVEGWTPPRTTVTWASERAWAPLLAAVAASQTVELSRELEEWDRDLQAFGGDPARHDWSAFRPLRLSREEDWSDWLAHTIEMSQTGRFPARLFRATVPDPLRWREVRVLREDHAERCVEGGRVVERYRADLKIVLRDGAWIAGEVKVGDLSLAKTPSTFAAMRAEDPSPCVGEYLLLPESDVSAWIEERDRLRGAGDAIRVLTWRDVARSLRRSVLEDAESLAWRSWALAFLGAVEQKRLYFPIVPRDGAPLRIGRVSACVAFARHLHEVREL